MLGLKCESYQKLNKIFFKGNGPKPVGPFKGKGKLQPAHEAQPVWRAGEGGDAGPSTGGR